METLFTALSFYASQGPPTIRLEPYIDALSDDGEFFEAGNIIRS